MVVLIGNFALACGPETDYLKIHIFQCMLERTDAITKEVLETITIVLVYHTVFHADKTSHSECTDANLCK